MKVRHKDISNLGFVINRGTVDPCNLQKKIGVKLSWLDFQAMLLFFVQ